MIFSTSFSIKAFFIFVAGFIFLFGCTAPKKSLTRVTTAPLRVQNSVNIAVLPIFNISRTFAPLNDIRKLFIDRLKNEGFSIIDDQVLETVMARHRIRYVGGLDSLTANALRKETGAEAVLITTLELYSDIFPPKIALTSRLVSTGERPEIVWIDGVGMAGDDAPGLLDLSLVETLPALIDMAIERLSMSLAESLSDRSAWINPQKIQDKFQPRISFHSSILTPGTKYRVAVVPFFNFSDRRDAGNIVAMHFARRLHAMGNFEIIEPGVVRQAMLKLRIIMDDGLSLANSDLIFHRLNVDLVLIGKTFDYQDYQGEGGTTKIDFSAQLIERKSREVVWSAKSYNAGDDNVFFFDWGRVNTAYAMASQMVQLAVEDIVRP